MGFAQSRWNFSPPWALGVNTGWELQWALGALENSLQTASIQAIRSAFPDYAGMDAGGVASQSLALIALDTQMLAPYGDDANLDYWRLWIKSALTPDPAGVTLSWMPNTDYATRQQVGVGTGASLVTANNVTSLVAGFVWTATTGGVSGPAFPVPQSPAVGAIVQDGTVTWQWSGATIGSLAPKDATPAATAQPPTPAWLFDGTTYQTTAPDFGVYAPGQYYMGTDIGLRAALINSGFSAPQPGGGFIEPLILTNTDWVNTTAPAGGQLVITGAVPDAVSVYADTSNFGGQHVGLYGSAGGFGTDPLWVADTFYAAGTFVTSSNGDTYVAMVPGTSGSASPFPGSTPASATWPPTAGMSFPDGTTGLQWVHATFHPIPAVPIPIGQSWGVQVTFTGNHTGYHATSTPAPPDGRTDAWSRLWLVLPGDQLVGEPLFWGPTVWLASASQTFVLNQLVGSAPVTGGGNIWKVTTAGIGNTGSFPSSPSAGDLWPVSPSMGQAQFTFTGSQAPAGMFFGQWAGPPSGRPFPADWGQTGRTSSNSAYSILKAILFGSSGSLTLGGQSAGGSGWLAGSARTIGAFIVNNVTQASDLIPDQIKNADIPAAPWNEALSITFNGIRCPFYRINSAL